MGNSTSGGTQFNGISKSEMDGKNNFPGISTPRRTAITEVATEICKVLINKSRNHNVGENISKKCFMRYFHAEKATDITSLLYDHISNNNSDAAHVSGDVFVNFCQEVCQLMRDNEILKFYTTLFSKNRSTIDRKGIESLFRTCFFLEAEIVGSKYACDPESPLLKSVIEAISRACAQTENRVNIDSLQTYLSKTFPKMLHSSIHRWLVNKVATVQSYPSEFPSTTDAGKQRHNLGSGHSCGNLKGYRSETDDHVLHPVLMWIFVHTLPSLYTRPKQTRFPSPVTTVGQCLFDYHEVLSSLRKYRSTLDWELLYNNASHGESINRFQHHVFSYRGPTVMLIKTDSDVMFCVAIDQEWRERVSRWGGDQCMVIQITPCFKIFEVGEKIMYFNLTTRGYPFGLHVGQQPKSPIVEIDSELCLAKVKKIPYKLEMLEIWGCAEIEVREQQIQQKKWEREQAEKHRKVNRKVVDWNDNPDRYILELAGRQTYGANFKR